MIFIMGFFFFALGIIIGSFLNVVILRLGTGRGIGGRSFCFTCGKMLRAFELIPLLSFLFQRGRCRGCKASISWQYPLVEFFTGVVFLLTFLRIAYDFGQFPLSAIPFYLTAFSILIAISVYDMRHKIVPDILAFLLAIIAFSYLITSHEASYFFTLPGVLDLLSGPILFLPFFFLWFLSRGRWMGLGDGKLALGIGWCLPFAASVSAIALGFWLGALGSLILLAGKKLPHKRAKALSMKSEIPFAPFLALGAFLAFLFSPDFFQLNLLLLGV